jgi:hypothetical protein
MFWMSAAAMRGVAMVNVMNSFARSDEFNLRYPDQGNLYALVNGPHRAEQQAHLRERVYL